MDADFHTKKKKINHDYRLTCTQKAMCISVHVDATPRGNYLKSYLFNLISILEY